VSIPPFTNVIALKISTSQWNVLAKIDEQRFLLELRQELIELRPALSELEPASLDTKIRESLDRARNYGLLLEGEQSAFARFCAVCGWTADLDKDSGYRDVGRYLADPTMDSPSKHQLLEEAVCLHQAQSIE
jgi:hypothetical protein